LEAEGDSLLVSPAPRCPPDFADELRRHKGEILAWLTRPPCPGWQAVPPEDVPLVPAEPKPTPRDRERVIGFLRRQTAGRPGPLAAWLVRRESAYYAGAGRTWDCSLLAYAAARDAATWQLGRTERELHDWLDATAQLSGHRPPADA